MAVKYYTPEEDRQLMNLINVHGFIYRHVAYILGRSPSSISNRVRLLRKRGFTIEPSGNSDNYSESQQDLYQDLIAERCATTSVDEPTVREFRRSTDTALTGASKWLLSAIGLVTLSTIYLAFY